MWLAPEPMKTGAEGTQRGPTATQSTADHADYADKHGRSDKTVS